MPANGWALAAIWKKAKPEDCLKREAREETGFLLEEVEPRGLVTFVSDRYETEYMHLFTCRTFSGTLHACSEGTLRWIPIAEVPPLPSLGRGQDFPFLFDPKQTLLFPETLLPG